MAFGLNNVVYDNGLSHVKSNCDKIIITNGVPSISDYAATAGLKLGEATVTAADFTIADAAGGGRKISHAAKQGTATATSNTAQDKHVAWLDSAAGVVLLVTQETTDQEFFTGNTIDFPANEMVWPAVVQA